MVLHGNFGLAALLTGDTDTAREAFRDELRLCRELVVLPVAAEGLLGLAAIAAARDDPDRAARLVGAAAAHAYGSQQHDLKARLDAAFLDPPAHATAPTTGTPPPATAAHAEVRRRDRLRPPRTAHIDPHAPRSRWARGAAPAQLDASRVGAGQCSLLPCAGKDQS